MDVIPNYSGFFFQPTLKYIKWQTAVSAVMLEIVEMYIFQIYLHHNLHVVYCNKTVIYSIFDFAPEIHFFEKIFPAFIDW
jgi:hypothetical protein